MNAPRTSLNLNIVDGIKFLELVATNNFVRHTPRSDEKGIQKRSTGMRIYTGYVVVKIANSKQSK